MSVESLPGDRPGVVHPRPITWRGFTFQVISWQPFTDEQAMKVVEHYIRTHAGELNRRFAHEVIEVRTALSRDEAARLDSDE